MSLCLTDDYNTVPMQRELQADGARKQQLQGMIQRAYSAEEEAQVAIELNDFLRQLTERELGELVNQGQISGPLAHLLAKFLHSSNAPVVLNSAMVVAQIMRDDGARKMLCKSGVHRLILDRLDPSRSSSATATPAAVIVVNTREVTLALFSCIQNVLLDGDSCRDFASRGGLQVVGSALHACVLDAERYEQHRQVQLETTLLACMANAMAHGEMQEFTHEMRGWIADLVALLARLKLPVDKDEAQYCVCAIANASRDPGLLHCVRASNGAESLERMKYGDDARIRTVAKVVLDRLHFNGARYGVHTTDKSRRGGGGDEDDDDDDVAVAARDGAFSFKFGGGKSNAAAANQERILGLVALLLACTALCGFALYFVWRLLSSGSYF